MRCQITGLFFMLTTLASGQISRSDTSLQLPLFEVSTTRLNTFLPGVKTEKIDSSLIQQKQSASIASLLSGNSAILIRSYGTGGLSTLSIRGTLSTQSGVFWNGFNLNQPNIGMTDLSLIPVAYFTGIEVQSGGGAAVAGNGLIGGQLILNNHQSYNTPLKTMISVGVGSFGEANSSIRFQVGTKKISWLSAINVLFDKNNFAYTNLNGNRERLRHAVGKGIGTLHQADIILSPKSFLSAGAWFQSSKREIPATLVMSSSDQVQYDESLRFTFQYSYITPRQRLQLRSAYFRESLHFSSPIALIDALYKLQTLNIETDYKRIWGKLTLNAGGNTRLQKAKVPYYKDTLQIQKGAGVFISALYHWHGSDWVGAFNLRQEFEEGYQVPLCPSLSVEGKLAKNWKARFNASRNFRVPTMNDKFWEPGGNPELDPETAWSQDIGIAFQTAKHKGDDFQYDISLYNLLVNNLIQWVNVNTTVWSPRNVNKVWSRGLETSMTYSKKIKQGRARIKGSYSYSPSTILKSGKENMQLIYIPLHQAGILAEIEYATVSANIHCSIYGKRFVNQDNSDELPYYTLINATFQKSFLLKQTRLFVLLEIRNLLNSEYQVMKYYPEPGISVHTQINIHF